MNNNFQSILIAIIIGLVVAVGAMAFRSPTQNPPDSAGQVIYADSSGNVGIGTSTPAYKLDVYGIIKGSSVLNPTYAP